MLQASSSINRPQGRKSKSNFVGSLDFGHSRKAQEMLGKILLRKIIAHLDSPVGCVSPKVLAMNLLRGCNTQSNSDSELRHGTMRKETHASVHQ